MNTQLRFIMFTLFALAAILFSGCGEAGVGDDDSGDDADDADDSADDDSVSDDDTGPTAESVIEAIVAEMTAGQLARTIEAYDQKVAPHLSDTYSHAGLGKAGDREQSLEDIEDNPWMVVDNYDLDIATSVDPSGKSATVTRHLSLQATMQAHEGLDFDVQLAGDSPGVVYFKLENDGEWRVIGGDAMFSGWTITGGDPLRSTNTDGIAVNVTQVGPGGMFRVSGDVTLPTLNYDEKIFVNVNISWGDDRRNAADWTDESSIYYQVDATGSAGSNFHLDIEMPGNGMPNELAIPDALPLGHDSVETQYTIFIIDAEGNLLRADGRSFNIPYTPLANVDDCSGALDTTADGLWLVETDNPDFDQLDYKQVLDLRVAGTDVFGALLYVAISDTEENVVALPVSGQIAGGQITFSFDQDDFGVGYVATWDGANMTNGVLTMHFTDGETTSTFTGVKKSNRCEGLAPDELDGKTITATFGGETVSYGAASEDMEVALSGDDGTQMTGAAVRNAVAVKNDSESGRWILFGFHDDATGIVWRMDGGNLVEGTAAIM